MPAATPTRTTQGIARPREKGQGAVESMLALPVFLLLSCLLIQSALLGVNQVLLQYAAYSAARVGAVRDGDERLMRLAAFRVLRLAPGCGGFPGPDFSLEILPATEGREAAVPSPPVPLLLRVRIAWRSPLPVPLAGPLLACWQRGWSWAHPVFSLRSSWGITREMP
jgi:hypothetical protein